jgi:hypothetical protein
MHPLVRRDPPRLGEPDHAHRRRVHDCQFLRQPRKRNGPSAREPAEDVADRLARRRWAHRLFQEFYSHNSSKDLLFNSSKRVFLISLPCIIRLPCPKIMQPGFASRPRNAERRPPRQSILSIRRSGSGSLRNGSKWRPQLMLGVGKAASIVDSRGSDTRRQRPNCRVLVAAQKRHGRVVDQFDCGRIAGLNLGTVGAYSTDVRAATNFHGAQKSRNWLGD